MIEEGLRTYILADATVSGLIGSRLYGVKLPQKPTLPAMVMSRVAGNDNYHTTGVDDMSKGRFQFDCWASDLAGSRELAQAVNDCLSGYSGSAGSETVAGAFLENRMDMYDDELDAHRVILDYIISYKET